MKIGILTDKFVSTCIGGEQVPAGGVSVYIQHLMQALVQTDEGAHEYYLLRSSSGPAPLVHPRVHSISLPLACRWPSVFVRHSGIWRDMNAHRLGLDLIHEPVPDESALRYCRYPLVVTVHDLIPLIHPDKFILKHRWVFQFYGGRNIRRADAIIAASESTRRDLIRFFPASVWKVTVIPLAGQDLDVGAGEPVDLTRYGISGPYILCVATLEPRKNHRALFDAYSVLKEKGFPHKLVCVGATGWKTSGILSHNALKTHASDIVLLGQVGRWDLGSLYRHASVFVFPSIYEGFGLPPLEALGAGVPVIAAGNSSLPEVLGQAALYLSANPDGEEIAGAIIRLLGDEALRRDLAQKGRLQYQRFSWSKTAAETLAVYRHVARSGPK